MERTFVGRNSIWRKSPNTVWAWAGVCVFDSGSAVRKFCASLHRAAGRAGRVAGSGRWTFLARTREQCVLPNWFGDADWVVEQECNFDRGVCRAIACERQFDRRCGNRGGTHPAAPNSDDIAGVYSWRAAVSAGNRRRKGGAHLGWYHCFWRNDRGDNAEPDFHSTALCGG